MRAEWTVPAGTTVYLTANTCINADTISILVFDPNYQSTPFGGRR